MCSVPSLDPKPLASLPGKLHAHTVLAAAPPVRPRRTRPHLCVRAHAIDPDDEIIPLLGPRRASFSPEELEALAHPRNTLGGKTIGEELGKKKKKEREASSVLLIFFNLPHLFLVTSLHLTLTFSSRPSIYSSHPYAVRRSGSLRRQERGPPAHRVQGRQLGGRRVRGRGLE